MCRRIGGVIITHSHSRVDIHAFSPRQRIIGVDETAFGALEVVSGEGIGDGTEAKLCRRHKGLSGHDDYQKKRG
jgi:hypothetical protein